MQTIKGFIVIPTLADNLPDKVAPFGELSTYSRTFSKDIRTLHSVIKQDAVAEVFHSYDDGVDTAISDDSRNSILDVAKVVTDLIKTNGIPDTTAALQTAIENDYGILDISLVNVGEIVNLLGKKGISFVEWRAHNVVYKFWFCNELFEAQYDEFIIDVTLPVVNIDDLMRPKDEVDPLLRGPVEILNIANTDNVGLHATAKTTLAEHTWYEKDNLSVSQNMFFGLEIYGKAGLSTDRQREALANAILADSAYDRVDWAQVFPTIFTTNEVYVLPFWDKTSVGSESLIGALHSPLVTLEEAEQMSLKYAHGYAAPHVKEHVQYNPLLYRSLASTAIGSPTNSDDKFKLSELHPELALIRMYSHDQYRLPDSVVAFLDRMYALIALAEQHTFTSTLPSNVTMETRGDFVYLASEVGGVNILVHTKYSYMRAEGHDYNPTDTYDFLGDHEC